MPNYSLVVTPQYNPMSYEQYARPFEDYAKVYNQMADAYDTLEMEANQWEKLAESAIDSPYYQQYQNYANDLRNAANELADSGLNVRTRGQVSKLRQRYAKEIKPIEDAYNYRQKLAEEQRKLNPLGVKIFDTDFSNISLGSIMRNPSIGYKTIDLPTVTEQVANAVANYKNVLRSSGQWKETNISGLLERIEQYGLTPQDLNAIMDENNTNPLYTQLRKIIDNAYYNTGVDSWDSDEKKAQVYNAALQGLPYGLGTGKVKDTDDPWMSYYIWKKQKEGSEEELPISEKFWDYVGGNVEIDEDIDLKKQKIELEALERWITSGKLPSKKEDSQIFMTRDPIFGDEQYPIRPVENAEYNIYTDLRNKYGTTDLQKIKELHTKDFQSNVAKKAKLSRWTTLNAATNERTVTDWLAPNILASRSDEKLKANTNFTDGNNKPLDDESLAKFKKALASEDTKLQINFNDGTAQIVNTDNGTFKFPLSVFNNLKVLGIDGDQYIRTISEGLKTGRLTEEASKKYIEDFYVTLTANTRMMMQEPGKTNSNLQIPKK